MFVQRFFEPSLAATSYLIGCEVAHEAIVIDPVRDVDQYIAAAEAEDARITHVTETHIHADFVSGSLELASRTGARLWLSDEGGELWKYGFAGERVKNGDRIVAGSVWLDALHTPGHTPEHLTWLVTDAAAATSPLAAATGDFLFVGDVGRPDLLERAAAMSGTMVDSARVLYRSLQAFLSQPEWLQIWPAHGAGSACGKAISAIPQSTLGYEKRFNWAFRTAGEDDFVRQVLEGQPDPPTYFGRMKRVNQTGPRVLGGLPKPPRLDASAILARAAAGEILVDMRPPAEFGVGHIPGSINLPFGGSFLTWAGWLLPDDLDVRLVTGHTGEAAARAAEHAARDLALIGLERVAGYWDGTALDVWAESGRPLRTTAQIGAEDLAASVRHGAVTVVDVRTEAEYENGHVPGARNVPLGHLVAELPRIRTDRPVVVYCQGGNRAAIAASLLEAHGVGMVLNFDGGANEWTKAGRALES